MFFGGFRLYNSWLHNNRTGIGMKMSDIKLPMMIAKTTGSETDAKTNISSSALYKYLGWTKSRRTGTNSTQGVYENGVPLLLYLNTLAGNFDLFALLDIFVFASVVDPFVSANIIGNLISLIFMPIPVRLLCSQLLYSRNPPKNRKCCSLNDPNSGPNVG